MYIRLLCFTSNDEILTVSDYEKLGMYVYNP